MIDERKICLGDILVLGLNFGDNWHHIVHVAGVLPLNESIGASGHSTTSNVWAKSRAVK